MADPTGTVGQTNESAVDLTLATRGGPKFSERLQRLADLTDRYEAAFAALNVGQDAAAAFQEAARARDAAQADRAAAAAELARARQDAANIRNDADRERGTASALRRDVEQQLNAARDKEQQAIEAGDAARQAVARADASRRKAEAKEKEFTDKIDRLKTELAKVA